MGEDTSKRKHECGSPSAGYWHLGEDQARRNCSFKLGEVWHDFLLDHSSILYLGLPGPILIYSSCSLARKNRRDVVLKPGTDHTNVDSRTEKPAIVVPFFGRN